MPNEANGFWHAGVFDSGASPAQRPGDFARRRRWRRRLVRADSRAGRGGGGGADRGGAERGGAGDDDEGAAQTAALLIEFFEPSFRPLATSTRIDGGTGLEEIVLELFENERWNLDPAKGQVRVGARGVARFARARLVEEAEALFSFSSSRSARSSVARS